MSQHETLQRGDKVTHPDWPQGTVRTICSFKGKRNRVVFLDATVEDGNGETSLWLEEHLVKLL